MDFELDNRIRQRLVAGRAAQFQFLKDLVGTASHNPPGNGEAIAERVAAELKTLGFGVERHRVPNELAQERGLAMVVNLVARQLFGAGNVVALNAHGDTAPAGEAWPPRTGGADPFTATIKGGAMTGLGVLAKADIATYAYALAALRDAGSELAGTVELHVTFDGETGGELGPKWLLDTKVVNPDYAIGSGLAYGIGTSAMGDLQMQVEIAGKRSGKAPSGGQGGGRADALETAGRVMTALYRERDGYGAIRSQVPGIGSPSLVIGEIEGGRRPDVAPDKVTFRLVRRLIPDEDLGVAERQLTRLIAETASGMAGIVCRIRRLKLVAPMHPVPGAGRLAETLERQASRATGRTITSYGVAFDTEARHYAAHGIPTVLYGAGPASAVEANMGGADEKLVLDDLRLATEVVALTLAEFLTPAG
ncbi:MAG: M20/M25/M40 family metallo-hydrolase [Rhodospirillales bacterium]